MAERVREEGTKATKVLTREGGRDTDRETRERYREESESKTKQK